MMFKECIGAGRANEGLRADWQQQLAQWQQAIGQVQLALKYNPNEAVLLKQLRQLYSQQQNYLQKVVQSGLV